MACNKALLLVALYCLYLPVTSTKLTTLLRDKNLTSLEERLTHLEQTIERRLNVTEVLLGQLLTGRNGANLETLNVLSLRSSILRIAFSPVLFSAYKSSSEGSISTNVKIRFEGTYINPGNHYHTENGIFIAPVTGVYMFHWTIATGGSAFTTQLMVAGSVRASNFVPYPGGADSSSAMVIISVNKEDHVWIQLYGSSEHVYGGSNSIGNYYQSTFSGILLQTS
uniref:Multimerin-2 n=1 Tax=Magallana gigas TaxID=29159 RepID=K1P6H9_MAGGI|eukprot:XP_011449385.1 PREDICTED: complement C1q tumor necrosis factor-related protein 7 [Crassostrea gigas]